MCIFTSEYWAQFFSTLDLWQILSSFIFLFAIVDPFGNMPITINMKKRGVRIYPLRVCTASFIILLCFLVGGEYILKLFGVQIEYFAIAGGIVVFFMALEMILDVVIFQNEGLSGEGSIVPLAFPMYAGPGTFTALISITSEYETSNLIVSIALNAIALYIVLMMTDWLSKYMGQTALYITRKFFGVIVLAISCKLVFGNLAAVFN